MDALKAEIDRKRKSREELTEGRKWVKRGDIEKREIDLLLGRAKTGDAVLASSVPATAAQAQVPVRSSKAPQEGRAATVAAVTAAAAAPAGESGEGVQVLPDVDVKKRLRTMKEPIALFGETAADRLKRYLVVSSSMRESHEPTEELRKGQLFNERQMHERKMLDQLEGSTEPVGAGPGAGDVKGVSAASAGGRSTTVQEGAGEDGSAPAGEGAKMVAQLDAFFGALEGNDTDVKRVLRTIHKLLQEWHEELEACSDKDRRSLVGKQRQYAFEETARNLRPLVQQLRDDSVPADIFQHVANIFKHVDAREYVAATDAYILAAIGNAPWPIGVTMVGIHSRSAREKIQTTHSAHVMNDETQRKYLQAIKRIITFAQKRHPTLPSQMVLHWNYDKKLDSEL